MTSILVMFHILLISVFSFWYFSIFSFSFLLTLKASRYGNINYGTNSLILIHYNSICFPCLGLYFTLNHDIPQNLHNFIFNNTFWSMFILFFTSFQVVFSTVSIELFLQHYHALYYFCANFLH